MSMELHEISAKTSSGTDIVDLSLKLMDIVSDSSIQNGAVLLFIPGSTAALTTIEFEVRLPFQVYEEAPKALRVILCKAHITVSGEALSAGPPI